MWRIAPRGVEQAAASALETKGRPRGAFYEPLVALRLAGAKWKNGVPSGHRVRQPKRDGANSELASFSFLAAHAGRAGSEIETPPAVADGELAVSSEAITLCDVVESP